MVPTVEFPLGTLLADQVTALLKEPVPCTWAEKFKVELVFTVAATGLIWIPVTSYAVGPIWTLLDAERVLSCVLVAVAVTVVGFGTVAGAVYTPEAEIRPTVESPPALVLTDQLTAVEKDPVPKTVALNVCDAPGWTVALFGLMETEVIALGG